MTSKNKKRRTQAAQFSKILKDLAIDVTNEDRSSAIQELKLSKSTISLYLAGDVRDNDTAVILIRFFKIKIQERFKAIESSCKL